MAQGRKYREMKTKGELSPAFKDKDVPIRVSYTVAFAFTATDNS